MSQNSARTKHLDLLFEALADATRRSMLDRLRRGPLSVTELAHPYVMSLNGVSKHIKKLEKVGLVRRHVRGREHLCSLEAGGLEDAVRWMNHYSEFWNERIGALETHLITKQKRRDSEQPNRDRT